MQLSSLALYVAESATRGSSVLATDDGVARAVDNSVRVGVSGAKPETVPSESAELASRLMRTPVGLWTCCSLCSQRV